MAEAGVEDAGFEEEAVFVGGDEAQGFDGLQGGFIVFGFDLAEFDVVLQAGEDFAVGGGLQVGGGQFGLVAGGLFEQGADAGGIKFAPAIERVKDDLLPCLLYTSPSPRD